MRKDMNEVIIEVARSGGYEKGGGRAEEKEKANGYEDSPIHEPKLSRTQRETKSQGDKLRPLRRFLETKVGQKWDDVYSEICEVNDKRSLVGFHLLSHLDHYVHAPGLRNKHDSWREYDFYVGGDGILRGRPQGSRWFRQDVKKDPIKEFRYRWEKGVWYRVWKEVITYSSNYTNEHEYKRQCGKQELELVKRLYRDFVK